MIIIGIILIGLMGMCIVMMFRLNDVAKWQRQWNQYVFMVRIAILKNEDSIAKYPEYDMMFKSIYSFNKMIKHFWKSPDKMVENREIYDLVISLGKKHNINNREEINW